MHISHTDLNGKYAVIGPLGVELGKVLDLEVEKIETGAKAEPTVLRVRSVEGKALKSPVACPYRMLVIGDRLALNRTYRIKAYQDGAFTGTPREVLRDLMLPTTDYFFQVSLVVFKVY